MATNENMKIWDKVCRTNPKDTKKMNFGPGLTAIDPTSQLKKATELWGPYGGDWGLENITFGKIDGTKNDFLAQATFYYPGGSFEVFADDTFASRKDAFKKFVTSLRSKALSFLGFNADVFAGQYDDEVYVEQQEKRSSSDGMKAMLDRLLFDNMGCSEGEADDVTRYCCGASYVELEESEYKDALTCLQGVKAGLGGGGWPAAKTFILSSGKKAK